MNAQIRQEAAAWLVELHTESPGQGTRERFADWLRASPEHVRAYLSVATIWHGAAAYDRQRQIDVDALIQETVESADLVFFSRRVKSAAVAETPIASEASFCPRLPYRKAVVAAVLLAVAGSATLFWNRKPSYSTAVGEQRTLTLADGSIVELNAASRIRLNFALNERVVELLEGEALFRVAKDKTRPFIVASANARVRAVGTEFDVNRRTTETVVTVLEGRVAVSEAIPAVPTAQSQGDSVQLAVGEQVAVFKRGAPRKSFSNVDIVTAWTQQQLIFETTPLSDVAEDFNRFNTQKLVMGDASVAAIKISGNFPALDPLSLPRFIRFLRDQPGLRVEERPEQILITQK